MRNIRNKQPQQSTSAGFTIVELMVATLVFSVILLVVTVGVIRFTHDYYEGVNTSTTQNLVRDISDRITQSIQFSGSAITPADTTVSGPVHGYFCAGGYEFIYDLGQQVSDSASTGLVQYSNQQNCDSTSHPPTSAPGWPTRTELLQPRMRLLKFAVKQLASGTLWQVDVKVGLGDNDQFCAPTAAAGSCGTATYSWTAAQLADPTVLADMRCKVQSGSQFCAVSELSTIVQKRVN